VGLGNVAVPGSRRRSPSPCPRSQARDNSAGPAPTRARRRRPTTARRPAAVVSMLGEPRSVSAAALPCIRPRDAQPSSPESAESPCARPRRRPSGTARHLRRPPFRLASSAGLLGSAGSPWQSRSKLLRADLGQVDPCQPKNSGQGRATDESACTPGTATVRTAPQGLRPPPRTTCSPPRKHPQDQATVHVLDGMGSRDWCPVRHCADDR